MEINRRQFLKAGTLGLAAGVPTSTSPRAIISTPSLRIALLHLAPIPGDLAHNRRLVETAIATAAGLGAAWIITPELCICGYSFADQIGTEWILPQPDPWMRELCQQIARLHVTVFLSHPERDAQTGKLYNSMLVIGTNGTILGTHRKINTLRVGSEAWSSPGDQAVPISVPPVSRVGVLICADAYSPGIARSLKAQALNCWYPPPRGLQASMGRMANGNNVPATQDSPFWSAIGRAPTGH
jgi:predicted amidohydrolase